MAVQQDEAERRAARLNAEHNERDHFEWKALPGKGGDWTVVRGPRRKRIDPLKATTEAKPKPRDQEDPRGPFRDIAGFN